MYIMINELVGSLMVKDADGKLVGFVTQRDLLRCIVNKGQPHFKLYDGVTEPSAWNLPISHVMTPSKDLVYLSPKDTLEDARALMSVSNKRHIPVIHGFELLGVISPKDIARALHLERGEDISAKASYVATVMPRKGVPLTTKLLEASEEEKAKEKAGQTFALRSAVCNLPHPHKESLGEDAFLLGPNMIGIADGVGSCVSRTPTSLVPPTSPLSRRTASSLSLARIRRQKHARPLHAALSRAHTHAARTS